MHMCDALAQAIRDVCKDVVGGVAMEQDLADPEHIIITVPFTATKEI